MGILLRQPLARSFGGNFELCLDKLDLGDENQDFVTNFVKISNETIGDVDLAEVKSSVKSLIHFSRTVQVYSQ